MSNVRSALPFLGIILGGLLTLIGQTRAQDFAEKEWWEDTIVYQIWPRSFQDSNGDGSGDLQGIISRLDHFEELGVETIWLNAIYPSPLTDSGYDVSDYKSIDSTYGDLDDFDELITAAHNRDLKVILDFIPNHSSVDHPWFKDSVNRTDPYTDYYVWHNGTVNASGINVPPNNWESVLSDDGEGSAWEWNEIRQQWYLHQFSKDEADLDLRNEAVIKELLDILDFWLKRGVDGFYVNGVPYFLEDKDFTDNPTGSLNNTFGLIDNVALLYSFREYIDSWVSLNKNTSKFLVAEGFEDDENLIAYYGNSTIAGIAPVNTHFITDFTSTSNASYIKSSIDAWLSALPENQTTNWKLSNQDYSRVATRLGLNRADGLNMFVLSLPGRVITYYGEEIAMLDNEDITYAETVDSLACANGEDGYADVSRDPYRTPMQWSASEDAGFTSGSKSYLPVHENYVTNNVATQLASGTSNIKTYKKVAALRSTPTFKNGSYEIQALNNDRVLVLRRSLEDHPTYILAINLGLSRQTVNLPEVYSDLPTSLNISVLSTNAVLSGTTVTVGEFTLTANAAVILTDAEVTNDEEEDATTTENGDESTTTESEDERTTTEDGDEQSTPGPTPGDEENELTTTENPSSDGFATTPTGVGLILTPAQAGEITGELDWWQTAVIYQIYTKSFKDSNGDGIGDLQGIISRLDYLEDTGVTGFSITPIYPSSQIDGGYDISDFFGIDPIFGSFEDFQELVDTAHEKNLKVILDVVPNHSSDQHVWFRNSIARIEPYTDYYVWRNGISSASGVHPPNNWLSVFGGSAWTWNEQRRQYYLHQFHTSQPDLNFRNPAVVAEFTNILRFWLDQGVDGFRVSSVAHLFEDANFPDEPLNENPGPNVIETDHEYLQHIYTTDLDETINIVYQWRSLMDEYAAQSDGKTRILITDSAANLDVVSRYFGNQTHQGAHLPLNFVLAANLSQQSSASSYIDAFNDWFAAVPENRTSNWILGNHDHRRVASRLGLNRVDGLNMLHLLPGTAFTYMGEELALLDTEISFADTQDPYAINAGPSRYHLFTRDPARTPYQWDNTTSAGFSNGSSTWLPVNTNYLMRNLASQIAADQSNYLTYKAILKLKQSETIKRGTTQFLSLNSDTVLAFIRELPGSESYVIVINLRLSQATVNLSAFTTFPKENVYVLLASANSIIQTGNPINVTAVPLSANAALVLYQRQIETVTQTPIITTTALTAASTTLDPTSTPIAALTTLSPITELPTTPTLINSEILGDLDWWQEANVYQIYPKSFQDSNGDGIGDLQGIISRLDHLEETGVTAIWLNSIFESPQVDGGFDVSNFTTIDPIFGSIGDFLELVRQAHARAIRMIIDFVPNHSSQEHVWFNNSINRIEPYTDYYVWRDGINTASGVQPPNNWLSVFGGSAWTWNEQRWQYYLHQFHTSQPDLNFRNPAVVAEFTNILRFWLDQGVDGFRVSSVAHLFEDANFPDEPLNENPGPNVIETDHEYLQHIYTTDLDETINIVYQWRTVVDQYSVQSNGETRILITDSTSEQHVVSRYFGNQTHQGAHLALNFAISANLEQQSSASSYADAVNAWFSTLPENRTSNWILGNHDRRRVASRLGLNRADGLNMLHLLPGTAFTYMGEELALLDTQITFANTQDPHAINAGPSRFHLFTRDPARTPYHWDNSTSGGFSSNTSTWLPINANYLSRNLAFQMSADRSNFNTWKTMLELRQSETIKRGATRVLTLNNDNVLAFTRELEAEAVFAIVINLGLSTVSVDLSGFSSLPSEGIRVCLASSNAIITAGTVVDLTAIPLSANAAVVLCNTELPETTTPTAISTTLGPTTEFPTTPILVNDEILGNLDWWQEANVYQIYPKSFQDSNGDGIGDLQGIISRLDHLNEMGVTAIWLNSVFESPQVDGGFDVSNFTIIDPIFGNIGDFLEFVRQAHARAIRVIIDFIPNHSSQEHVWFNHSINRIEPYTDYYVWRDGINTANGVQPPNNWLSVFGGSAWTWNEQRQQYYLHQFHTSQPDLNFRNPAVVAEFINILRFWLDQGVDGFRVSSVAHLFEDANFPDEPLNENPGPNVIETDHEYLQHIYTTDLDETINIVYQWRTVVDQYSVQSNGETRILITDSTSEQHVVSRYFGNQTHQGAHLALNFAISANLEQQSSASSYANALNAWFSTLPENRTSNWILGNHDRRRVASRLGLNRADGLNMLHLLPGTAFTYMGEELALLDTQITFANTQDPHAINAGPSRFHLFTRDPARTPYHWDNSTSGGFSSNTSTWLPINANYLSRNLALQISADRSNFNTYKTILELRQSETIKRGATRVLTLNNDNVFAFTRELEAEAVFAIVINLGFSTVSVNLSGFSSFPSEGIRVCIASSNAIITTGTVVDVTAVPLSANAAVVLCNTEMEGTTASTTTTTTPSPTAETPSVAPTTSTTTTTTTTPPTITTTTTPPTITTTTSPPTITTTTTPPTITTTTDPGPEPENSEEDTVPITTEDPETGAAAAHFSSVLSMISLLVILLQM